MNIGNYLFNWDNKKFDGHLTIVENTFNAIRYDCTTCFSSHLSDTQAGLIKRSRVRSVGIMFDEGAGEAGQRAVEKLRRNGVRAAYVTVRGQPDDHSDMVIQEEIKVLEDAANKGRMIAF